MRDLFYSYDDLAIKMNVHKGLYSLSQGTLGTDDLGRTLPQGYCRRQEKPCYKLQLVRFALVVGSISGSLGLYGGVLDNVIMRIIDILMAIPMTMLAIVIVAARPSQFQHDTGAFHSAGATFARSCAARCLPCAIRSI